MKSSEELVDDLIKLAFAEDIGDGDHTTLCCIPSDEMGKSKLLVKEPGVLAGVEVAKKIFRDFDPEIRIKQGNQYETIESYLSCNTEYTEVFNRCISEIFDPAVPFSQTPCTDHCQYCDFTGLCKR